MANCYDIKLEKFTTILRWAKQKGVHEESPVLIPKIGGISKLPTRLWPFGSVLLLAANEKSKNQQYYILTKKEWASFTLFYNKLSSEKKTAKYLGDHYKEWGCTNYAFWPSVLAISKAYQEELKHTK